MGIAEIRTPYRVYDALHVHLYDGRWGVRCAVVSVDALSALNIVNPLFSLVMGFGVMLGAGGSAVIAKNIGEGEEQQAFDNLSTLVFFGAILGLVLMVLLLVFMEPILSVLGATEILMPYCKEYCYYIVGFLAPWVLELMFSSYFITAGKPQIGLIATLCSGIFNIVGDYFLIVVVGMGIRGAALATRACDLHSCSDRAHLLLQ